MTEDPKTKKAPRFLKKRKILTAESLDDAVRGSDTYAKSKVLFGNLALSLLRTAGWRRRPATNDQKEFLRKRLESKQNPLVTHTDGDVKKTHPNIDNLTKGDAANIITRLRHGAQARYSTRIGAARKKALVLEKERQRRAREEVQVGNLSI